MVIWPSNPPILALELECPPSNTSRPEPKSANANTCFGLSLGLAMHLSLAVTGNGLVSTWIHATSDSYGRHQIQPATCPRLTFGTYLAHFAQGVSRCRHLQLDDARRKQLVFTGIFTEHSEREARKALMLQAKGLARRDEL